MHALKNDVINIDSGQRRSSAGERQFLSSTFAQAAARGAKGLIKLASRGGIDYDGARERKRRCARPDETLI